MANSVLIASEKTAAPHPLPSWMNANARLAQASLMAELSQTAGVLAPLCIGAVSGGRKLRSSVAIQYAKWIRGDISEDGVVHLSGMLVSVEFLHAASCILDDLIDGDTLRRGQPVFHVREGLPQALLVVQELVRLASRPNRNTADTGFAPSEPGVTSMVNSAIHKSLIGEAYDSFPLRQTLGSGVPSLDLVDRYLLKTTAGFELAFGCLSVFLDLPKSERDALKAFGTAFGAFYQVCNDYYDWFDLSQTSRGAGSDHVRVPLCMPTIFAMMEPNNQIRNLCGNQIARNEFAALVERVSTPALQHNVANHKNKLRTAVLTSCTVRPIPRELSNLLDLIDSSHFWGYKYRIHE